jgi:hypothetical protein
MGRFPWGAFHHYDFSHEQGPSWNLLVSLQVIVVHVLDVLSIIQMIGDDETNNIKIQVWQY